MSLLTRKPSASPDVSALSQRVDTAFAELQKAAALPGLDVEQRFDAAYESMTRSYIEEPAPGQPKFPDLSWPEEVIAQLIADTTRTQRTLAGHLVVLREATEELAGTLARERAAAQQRATFADMATLRTDANDLRPCCDRPASEPCGVEVLTLEGETWRRMPFGSEPRGGGGRRSAPLPANCPGCGAPRDAYHHFGCLAEACPAGEHAIWSCSHERRIP